MKIYFLDKKSKSLEQMLFWLSEDQKVEAVEVFADYIRFIERVGDSPPDFCVIRLGSDKIPGLKMADMVQQMNLGTRIVFMSDDRDYAVDAFEVGAYGYLISPVEKKCFLKLFESISS